MWEWSSILPVTTIIALIIFFTKETLEFLRRRVADQRRRRAIARFFARECELNLWTIRSLREILTEVSTEENPRPASSVSIHASGNGRPYAEVEKVYEDGTRSNGHYPIPSVHRDMMAKYVFDTALLDKKLFESSETALDALAELDHIRESLLRALHPPEFMTHNDYLEAFSGYALDELLDVEKSLSELYLICTDKKLENHRLR